MCDVEQAQVSCLFCYRPNNRCNNRCKTQRLWYNRCMNCSVCSRPLSNPKAKFCSGACKFKFRRRGSATIIEPNATIILPEKKNSATISKDWRDTYGLCDGCDGSACPGGFVPNSPDKRSLNALRKLAGSTLPPHS